MIVCICANVNSKAIEKALDEGCTTLDELVMQTGACSGCGQCRQECQAMIQRASEDETVALNKAGVLVAAENASLAARLSN